MEIALEGDLFGNEQLYPGKTITGIIRIISNSDTSIKISSMSLDIDIIEHKKEYQKRLYMIHLQITYIFHLIKDSPF